LRVYLEIPIEALVARLQRSPTIRPLVGPSPTVERVRELLTPREAIYLESDIVVRGPRRSKRAFALEIAARLRERAEMEPSERGEGSAR
jgi:shikimate kinase